MSRRTGRPPASGAAGPAGLPHDMLDFVFNPNQFRS